jgi:phosphopantetheinyl transferase
VTRWAFAVDAVVVLEDEPIALIQQAGPTGSKAETADRHALRRRVLTQLASVALGPRADIRLAVNANGHRYLDGTKVFASVAYRNGWVAAVLSREPVGIDIESIDDAGAAAEVVLAGVDAGTNVAAWGGLAGVWAAREAVLKAQGRDLTRDHARWTFGDGQVRGGDASALRVDIAHGEGFVAAVAYAGD